MKVLASEKAVTTKVGTDAEMQVFIEALGIEAEKFNPNPSEEEVKKYRNRLGRGKTLVAFKDMPKINPIGTRGKEAPVEKMGRAIKVETVQETINGHLQEWKVVTVKLERGTTIDGRSIVVRKYSKPVNRGTEDTTYKKREAAYKSCKVKDFITLAASPIGTHYIAKMGRGADAKYVPFCIVHTQLNFDVRVATNISEEGYSVMRNMTADDKTEAETSQIEVQTRKASMGLATDFIKAMAAIRQAVKDGDLSPEEGEEAKATTKAFYRG